MHNCGNITVAKLSFKDIIKTQKKKTKHPLLIVFILMVARLQNSQQI